ncbi:glycine--tRNA ligase subunit beta, partial [Escherichia coli]
RKKRLEDNLPRLQTLLFQQQLGTLRDKTDRIHALAGWIAEQIGADVNHATRAGLLSKQRQTHHPDSTRQQTASALS